MTVVATLLVAVTLLRSGASQAQVQSIYCQGGFEVGIAPIPPLALQSLATVPNPVLPNGPSGAPRDDLVDFIALASFKTSALRNLELSGPYFHNGGKSTLKQVVEFYNGGGDFPAVGDPQRGAGFDTDRRSPIIKLYDDLSAHGLGMTPSEIDDLVAFLISLSDDRVRYQRAPFDHPELVVPNGQNANDGSDITMTLPAVGAAGSAKPLKPFLTLNPFQRQ